MRKKTRADIVDQVVGSVRLIVEGADFRIRERVAEVVPALTDEIRDIQPAKVDLSQELADDIVRKIHGPLTISKEFSNWLAEQGKFHDLFYVFPIGYGSDAGRGEIRATANGTMFLQIRDCNGADLWRGTFVPPDFGKS